MKNSDKKAPNEEQNEKLNQHKTDTAADHRPTMQSDDSTVQNPNRNLPKGGNPTGRGGEHNSVSGGKSLQGNNARSKPTSDKTHN